MKAYRYFPYEGNRYHELRIAPGTAPGSVELVVVKGGRSESIVIQAKDVEAVTREISSAAAGPKAGEPGALRLNVSNGVVDLLPGELGIRP